MRALSLILAAGRGTRMIGYGGCKALLPLKPSKTSIYIGKHPFILEILSNLPPGPKGIVIHHEAKKLKDTVEDFISEDPVVFIFQPILNGTGGALLASRFFLESFSEEALIVTMGDVPLVKSETYSRLTELVIKDGMDAVILAFRPADKAQYGCLILEEGRVRRIVEWKYWKDFSPEAKEKLIYCNGGVYVFKRKVVLKYMDRLSNSPHRVEKVVDGKFLEFEEFFITDLIEWLSEDGYFTSFFKVPEEEIIGVDKPEDLVRVQHLFSQR